MPCKNVIVTAHWTPIQYSISYVLDGGINAPGNPTTYNADMLPLSIAAASKSGYVLQYWMATYANGSSSPLPASVIPVGTIGNVKLNAVWGLSTYAITYELNGGINAPGNPTTYNVDSSFTINSNTVSDPFMLGFRFLNWAVSFDNGTVFDLTSAGIPAGSTGDVLLVAIWDTTPILYNIVYVLDGGVNAAGNPSVYAVTSIFPINIDNPTKAGNVFLGWMVAYSNGTTVSLASSYSIPTGSACDVTLTAVWSYNISYELSGGINAPGNPTSYSVNNLPMNIANPSKSGYILSYWIMTCADGTMTILTNGVIPTGTVDDVTLVAVWAVAPSYSITYMLNSGTNAPSNPDSYTISTTPIGIANPTKAGATFSYWIVIYSDGFLGVLPSSGIPAGTIGDITLVAVWA
jgi:uncharacterized repeat protein (TIGR02543 family)